MINIPLIKECNGECPVCGNELLDYSCSIMKDNNLIYPFECKQCGCKGKEILILEYLHTEYERN